MKKVKSLVLTLGHNSSAIGISADHEILAGYENERLTKKKSDSSFPKEAILEIFKNFEREEQLDIYVSHWFQDYKLVPNKYWDEDFVNSLGDYRLISLSDDFTHHDAHCYSALAYTYFAEGTRIYVMDGFGSKGEVFTEYKIVDGKPALIHRCFDILGSLGLWYQYTTAYLGYKENQDEYKLLGHAAKVLDAERFREDVDNLSYYLYKALSNSHERLFERSLLGLDLGGLAACRKYIYEFWESLSQKYDLKDNIKFIQRDVIAYILQTAICGCCARLMKFDSDAILVGGVFYNVGLNNEILRRISMHNNEVFINPLAGDQGAGLGVYKFYNSAFWMPSNLYFGVRVLETDKEVDGLEVKRLYSMNDFEDISNSIAQKLNNGEIVNIVRGAMEFGPRALCHTTTLAKPTEENVELINKANGRSTIMPMAPVMDIQRAWSLFNRYEFKGLHGISAQSMICAVRVRAGMVNQDNCGAMLKDNVSGTYSARPQIVSEQLMADILHECDGILINTSFNVHGQPIVFNMDDVIYNHNIQRQTIKNLTTFVIQE